MNSDQQRERVSRDYTEMPVWKRVPARVSNWMKLKAARAKCFVYGHTWIFHYRILIEGADKSPLDQAICTDCGETRTRESAWSKWPKQAEKEAKAEVHD